MLRLLKTLYCITFDPNDSDFVRAGLVYTVSAGETNLIGFHTQGNYNTAVSEAFAIMGLTLFAEYIDAISVVTITDDTTLGRLTVTSAQGTKSGETKVTVEPSLGTGHMYKYKVAADSAPAVKYGQSVKNCGRLGRKNGYQGHNRTSYHSS